MLILHHLSAHSQHTNLCICRLGSFGLDLELQREYFRFFNQGDGEQDQSSPPTTKQRRRWKTWRLGTIGAVTGSRDQQSDAYCINRRKRDNLSVASEWLSVQSGNSVKCDLSHPIFTPSYSRYSVHCLDALFTSSPVVPLRPTIIWCWGVENHREGGSGKRSVSVWGGESMSKTSILPYVTVLCRTRG